MLGTSSMIVEVEHGARVADVVRQVCQDHPRLRELASSLLVAVNTEYVSQDATLRDGDEVALIPPVSGG
jgi:molybdopterin converting factor subunit 1